MPTVKTKGQQIRAAPCLSLVFAATASLLNVSLWHKADMCNALANVRFWGQSGLLARLRW